MSWESLKGVIRLHILDLYVLGGGLLQEDCQMTLLLLVVDSGITSALSSRDSWPITDTYIHFSILWFTTSFTYLFARTFDHNWEWIIAPIPLGYITGSLLFTYHLWDCRYIVEMPFAQVCGACVFISAFSLIIICVFIVQEFLRPYARLATTNRYTLHVSSSLLIH